MRARITATAHDGAQWGWPGVRVVRYETSNGEWAWIPGDQEVDEYIEFDDLAIEPEDDKTKVKEPTIENISDVMRFSESQTQYFLWTLESLGTPEDVWMESQYGRAWGLMTGRGPISIDQLVGRRHSIRQQKFGDLIAFFAADNDPPVYWPLFCVEPNPPHEAVFVLDQPEAILDAARLANAYHVLDLGAQFGMNSNVASINAILIANDIEPVDGVIEDPFDLNNDITVLNLFRNATLAAINMLMRTFANASNRITVESFTVSWSPSMITKLPIYWISPIVDIVYQQPLRYRIPRWRDAVDSLYSHLAKLVYDSSNRHHGDAAWFALEHYPSVAGFLRSKTSSPVWDNHREKLYQFELQNAFYAGLKYLTYTEKHGLGSKTRLFTPIQLQRKYFASVLSMHYHIDVVVPPFED